MNADESLKGHETEGCEIAGNIQEMILSQVLQGCLLRLEMTFPTDHVHFFLPMETNQRVILRLKAECLKA